MPIHDWSQVKAGIFHGFHVSWLAELKRALNTGALPPDYYADAEQYADDKQPDVLTLHESEPSFDPLPDSGGVATLPALRTGSHLTAKKALRPLPKKRRIVVRHVSGHRAVAFVELVSRSNLDRQASRAEFVEKARANIASGLHVTVLNLFPPRPGRRDLSAAVWRAFDRSPVTPPTEKPLTFASFVSKKQVEAYFEFLAVGDELPPMPLFLTPTRHVPLPLAETYQEAFAGSPPYLRRLLEAPSAA